MSDRTWRWKYPISETPPSDSKPLLPGEPDAVYHGCTCPVYDNRRGKGVYTTPDGTTVFWISDDCPLHKRKEVQSE